MSKPKFHNVNANYIKEMATLLGELDIHPNPNNGLLCDEIITAIKNTCNTYLNI